MARINRKVEGPRKASREDIRNRRVSIPRNGNGVDKEAETRAAAARLLNGLDMRDVPEDLGEEEMSPDEQARMEYLKRAGKTLQLPLVNPQGQAIRATAEPRPTRVAEPEEPVSVSPLVEIIDNASREFASLGYEGSEVIELAKAYAILESGNAIASFQSSFERFVIAVEVLAGIRTVQK